MNNSLTLFTPIEGWQSKKIEEKNWYKSKELYEEKKYLKSLKTLFDFIDKKNFKKYKDIGIEHYKIPNFKNWVDIEVTGNKLYINMDVVKINSENIIQIGRQILNLNMNFFSLPTICIDNDTVKVSYSCYLDSVNTLKVYRCLREFGNFSCVYTQEFVEIYNAKLPQEPKITYYKEKEYEKIFKNINFLIEQAHKYCEYFEKKLQYSFSWDIVFQTLLDLETYLSPKGILKKDLDKTLDVMWDKNIDSREQYFTGINFLNKLKEIKIEDLKKYVYKSEKILYDKKYYSGNELSSFLKDSIKSGKELLESNDYIKTYMCYNSWLLCALYNGNIEEKGTYKKIMNAIEYTNNKKWEKAAKNLDKIMKQIVFQKLVSNKNLFYYIILYLFIISIIGIIRHYT